LDCPDPFSLNLFTCSVCRIGPEKKNRQGKRKQRRRRMYESEQAENKAENFFIKIEGKFIP